MGSFSQSLHSSPVAVLPPSQPLFKMDSNRPLFSSPFANGISDPTTVPSNFVFNTSAPSSAAGRKRSRDEAAPNLEDEYFLNGTTTIEAKEPENEDEWVYGEGMTLIKPNAGYVMEAESQTGTWAEEKAEEERVLASSPERPSLRAAKTQRLDLTATPPIAEEELNNGALTSAPSPERSTGLVEPTVDDYTRHLGIGWSLISTDEDIQAAARGWTRFIENHFPVTDAKIALQSRGLASYLVEANEGYFLFGEDLKQGRLVSTSLERVWVNLKGPTPIFDGESILEAVETPKAGADMDAQAMMNGENAVMNGVHNPAADEMDMS